MLGGHRVPDHRESFLADRIVRRQIIRRVEPDPFNGIAGSEDMDIDGLSALQSDVLELLVFEDDVVVLAPLIAFDLVFVLTSLPVTAST